MEPACIRLDRCHFLHLIPLARVQKELSSITYMSLYPNCNVKFIVQHLLVPEQTKSKDLHYIPHVLNGSREEIKKGENRKTTTGFTHFLTNIKVYIHKYYSVYRQVVFIFSYTQSS